MPGFLDQFIAAVTSTPATDQPSPFEVEEDVFEEPFRRARQFCYFLNPKRFSLPRSLVCQDH